ncbi:MAG TPA: methylated-DNA--[protein]-cysteine S-methyltransferase, partial [Candidatus Limnocylindrales bacterium]|nr:methylated-DNA--[protein]-cysteine S-methyltransferase [Candidatus Limnocylindrales bacterium]
MNATHRPTVEPSTSPDEPLSPELESVAAALRDLRTTAPPRVRDATLVALGLADAYARFDSPIGPVAVAWNGRGVSAVVRASGAGGVARSLEAEVGRRVVGPAEPPPSLARRIAARLAGDRRVRLPVDLRSRSPFDQAVLRKALEIPSGEVRPYAWIATEIGRPRAVRAVGSALRRNPVPLLVPCHRVVRSDGRIGEYSLGGPETKRALLSHEGVDVTELERLALAGVRFVGSRTTR